MKAEPSWSCRAADSTSLGQDMGFNIAALIIRIGVWGPLYCNYNQEPPK